MNLIKQFLRKLYSTKPFLFIRSKLSRKINSILSQSDFAENIKAQSLEQQTIIQQELIALKDLQKHQINLENNQLEFLRAASNKQDSIHEKLNFHNNALAQIKTEAIIKHDAQIKHLQDITANQGFSAVFNYRDNYVHDFTNVVKKIIGKDYPNIVNHIEDLFTEIFIGHMQPGGLWKLRRDIFSFIDSHPFKEKKAANQLSSEIGDAPLKILIISGTFPSLLHGGGGRLLDIITELSNTHQIDLFSHYIEELDSSTLDLLQDKVDNIKLVTSYKDFTVEHIGAWVRSLGRATHYYDIVQLEYPQTIRFINPIRQYGKKVGYTFMESLALSYTEKLEGVIKTEDYDNITGYSRSFWQSLSDEKYAMLNADFCIAVTDKDADFLHRLDNKELNIIPTCVSTFAIINELEKHKDVTPEENSVCFIGFFGHWPNIEAMQWYLTDIHPIVKKELPNYKFYIVGSGDISLIKKLSEGDENVVVTGKVDSIVPHLLKAKVCISPLISGAGIRGKQNQYSLVGRPSVTTSIGNKGLEYVHEESVMIADEAKDFARSIVRLLTDEGLYDKVQNNCKKIAEDNYTWKAHLANLVDIYKKQ